MSTIYDLIVIGGGSGGVRTARIAASLGARVAIIEDTHWGGTCVNVGCVPKKMYHYAASISKQVKLGKAYGWDISQGSIDWQAFHAAKETEIARLQGIYAKMLGGTGCDVINGFGEIKDASSEIKTIQVGDATYQSKRILLAVGSTPYMPDIEGVEHCIDSDQLFALKRLPKRMLVVGGGYIGCEMASIYHGLGTDVTLAVRSKLLRGFDEETVGFLQEQLTEDGLNIQLGISPTSVATTPAHTDENPALQVSFDNGTTADYDCVLMAAGRKPRFDGLGLDNTRISFDDKGLIHVNDTFETEHTGIYAVGDIISGPDLTPLALEQGMYLARQLFADGEPLRPNFEQIATAIFTHPQMATVGMAEEAVIEKGIKADIYTSNFRHLKYTITDIQQKSFIKLIVEQATDKILGIHMVGEEVGEIMQGFGALVAAGGTKRQLDQTIGIHPTVAEELVTMREPTRVVGA